MNVNSTTFKIIVNQKPMLKIKKTQQYLKKEKLSAVLITDPINIRYLSGFTGTNGWLLISLKKVILITDFRYLISAKKQLSKNIDIYDQKLGFEKLLNKYKKVAFEEGHVTVNLLKSLKKKSKKVKFIGITDLVQRIRMIKDKNEIKIIRAGTKIADECLKRWLKTVKVGILEKELSWNLLSIAKSLGAEEFSFPPIITFGKNTADVHHQQENNTLKKGEYVLIDFGIKYKNYCTDMTRVFFPKKSIFSFKEKNSEEQKIYSIVLSANKKVIQSIKLGIKFSELDKIARDVIEKAGYGKYFGHSLGHGVGLEVHELPSVSPASDDIVKEGMVFTVEPGIYVDGVGGVRIEDMVYVGKGGKVEVLTKFGKEMTYVNK